jgi:hypothetical protein
MHRLHQRCVSDRCHWKCVLLKMERTFACDLTRVYSVSDTGLTECEALVEKTEVLAEKNLSHCYFVLTNLTWTGAGSNLFLCGERPASNCLYYVTGHSDDGV